MKAIKSRPVVLLFVLFTFCSDTASDPPSGGDTDDEIKGTYRAVAAFPSLSFNRPVDLQHPGDNSNRLFVLEQAGIISVFENQSTAAAKKVFLDIRAKVNDGGNEEGLLGLAFHPNYETNGFFFVNYTASGPRRTVISRFQVSQDPLQADASSEQVLITFDQPYSNHNGGQISFGPDGYLYIATGDGGSGGDPHGNGQNRATLLGAILRIDVDKQEDGKQYAIPPDNPFHNNTSGYREEIYAYGLRNPWRFSFDSETNKLWTGDVGQNDYEEIDVIEKGGNYGWNIMEGKHCFEPSSGCNQSGLKAPIVEYGRGQGISVTGGFVYRGAALPELVGKYLYADYGSGRVWALNSANLNSPGKTELMKVDFNISSFGVDKANELYMCAFDGKIYRIQKEQ